MLYTTTLSTTPLGAIIYFLLGPVEHIQDNYITAFLLVENNYQQTLILIYFLLEAVEDISKANILKLVWYSL